MSMFCYQCQETAMGTGCTLKGVCGKTSEVANLQDLLLFVIRGIAVYNEHLRKEGHSSEKADKFIYDSLFITITNANFDKAAIIGKIKEGLRLKKELGGKVSIKNAPDECLWNGNEDEFEEKAKTVGVLRTPDEDIRSLKELVHYGLKGMAAYVEHAHNLGYQSPEIFAFMQHALAELTRNDITMEELVQLTLETGQHGVSAMAQLDTANTSSYGNPEITEVNIGVRNNPGILISGHDLKDLEELLEQTEGTGIDIYTHSEMLPAHYYPQLKKYKHLAGNYGNAWWKQKEEFESFNGPILFTSNCIVPPRSNASYKDRIYVTGACGLEGAHYIPERKDGKPKDFSSLIAHAKQCQPPVAIENGTLIGGFAHAQVTALADKVVEAVNILKERNVDFKFDGELQLDASIVPSVAEKKAPGSNVAGKANILIFPDLQAANIGYKLVQRFSGADALGPLIQGLAKPVHDLSRGCSAQDVVDVAAIAAVESI